MGGGPEPAAGTRVVEMTPRESSRWRARFCGVRVGTVAAARAARRGGDAERLSRRHPRDASGTERVLSSIERKDEMVVALNERADQLRTIIGTADLPIVKVDADMRASRRQQRRREFAWREGPTAEFVVGESLGAYLLPPSPSTRSCARAADAENVPEARRSPETPSGRRS